MIWVIGDRGMLGTELREELERRGLPFVGSDRETSILDDGAMRAFAAGKGISAIINCAAYTAVDKAEDEVELCTAINAEGPEHIGRVGRELGARVIHISTDYVFDGSATRPYREDDPVSPLGVYGKTKAEGEARLLAACPGSVIVRTAWLYGLHGPNFVYTMLKLMNSKPRIGVVADQLGSPTWARDLAGALVEFADPERHPEGIYHFTNEGVTSWHGFALEIHRLGRKLGLIERDCEVAGIGTEDYPTKAARPAYSVMSKEQTSRELKRRIPIWEASLAKFLELVHDHPEAHRRISG